MESETLELAAALCRQFEGRRLRPYLCPAGVPTIGYGSTRYADGRSVTLADPAITAQEASALLLLTLRRDYLPRVVALCPGADTPGRVAALTDFAYNVGVGALRASTLRRLVNNGDWDRAAEQLMRWIRGGGRVLPGLVRRRAAEVKLLNAARVETLTADGASTAWADTKHDI